VGDADGDGLDLAVLGVVMSRFSSGTEANRERTFINVYI
jgi:hypothetical protein